MLVWLLDLHVGPRTVRLSTSPVSWGGEQYEGGLDGVRLEESLGQLGSLPDERSAVVDAVPTVDLAQWVSWAHDLGAGRGTLRLWDTSTAEATAEVYMLDARVTTPDVGGQDEPVSLTLSAEPYDDGAAVVDDDAWVSAATWPDAKTEAIGARYPLPVGRPGFYRSDLTGAARYIRGSQAYAVEWGTSTAGRADTLLVGAEAVQAPTVDVWAVTGGTSFRVSGLAIAYVLDGLGRRCAVVDVTAESAAFRSADRWYLSWEDGPGVYLSGSTPGEATAGALLYDLAERSGLPIDRGEWRRARSLLPYPVGYDVAREDSPVDLLAEMCERLGVALWSAPNGIAPAVVSLDPVRPECVVMVEGVTCHRAGRMTLPRRPDEALTAVRVQYAWDAIRESYGLWEVRSAGQAAGADVYVRTTSVPLSDAVEDVEVPWTYSAATAQAVAGWMTRSRAVSPRVVTYDVPVQVARTLRLGQPVRVTDPDLHLDDVIGHVTGRSISVAAMWPIEVSLMYDPGPVEEGTGASDDAPPTPPAGQ